MLLRIIVKIESSGSHTPDAGRHLGQQLLVEQEQRQWARLLHHLAQRRDLAG